MKSITNSYYKIPKINIYPMDIVNMEVEDDSLDRKYGSNAPGTMYWGLEYAGKSELSACIVKGGGVGGESNPNFMVPPLYMFRFHDNGQSIGFD